MSEAEKIVRALAASDPSGDTGHCHFCANGGYGPGAWIEGEWHSEACLYRRAVAFEAHEEALDSV